LPHIIQVHHLHIWALSTQEVALTAHLVFPTHFNDDLLLEKIQTDLLEQFQIHHATLQVERGSQVCKEC
jgi:cobalt-zinc-cadmium efflux system protein